MVYSLQVWNSSKARSARDSLRKQMTRTSLKVTDNKRFPFERSQTATSILNSDISTSRNMSVSFEDLVEDPKEMQENGEAKIVPTDAVTAQETENRSVEKGLHESLEADGQECGSFL